MYKNENANYLSLTLLVSLVIIITITCFFVQSRTKKPVNTSELGWKSSRSDEKVVGQDWQSHDSETKKLPRITTKTHLILFKDEQGTLLKNVLLVEAKSLKKQRIKSHKLECAKYKDSAQPLVFYKESYLPIVEVKAAGLLRKTALVFKKSPVITGKVTVVGRIPEKATVTFLSVPESQEEIIAIYALSRVGILGVADDQSFIPPPFIAIEPTQKGLYRLDRLVVSGPVKMIARAHGSLEQTKVLKLAANQSEYTVDFDLSENTGVFGTIYYDGRAVAKAKVTVYTYPKLKKNKTRYLNIVFQGITNELGEFEANQLTAGDYVLFFTNPVGMPTFAGGKHFSLAKNEMRDLGNFLVPKTNFFGRLVGPDNEPIGNVEVLIRGYGPPPISLRTFTTRTNPNGEFQAAVLNWKNLAVSLNKQTVPTQYISPLTSEFVSNGTQNVLIRLKKKRDDLQLVILKRPYSMLNSNRVLCFNGINGQLFKVAFGKRVGEFVSCNLKLPKGSYRLLLPDNDGNLQYEKEIRVEGLSTNPKTIEIDESMNADLGRLTIEIKGADLPKNWFVNSHPGGFGFAWHTSTESKVTCRIPIGLKVEISPGSRVYKFNGKKSVVTTVTTEKTIRINVTKG